MTQHCFLDSIHQFVKNIWVVRLNVREYKISKQNLATRLEIGYNLFERIRNILVL